MIDHVVAQAVDAVRAVGQLARTLAGNTRVAYFKPNGEVVTHADLMVNDALRNSLNSIDSAALFVSEEDTQSHALYTGADRMWIVDPIDGSVDFMRGLPNASISAALVIDRRIVAGIIYDMFRDEMFYAISGVGSFLNASRIAASSCDEPRQALIGIGALARGQADSVSRNDQVIRLVDTIADFRRLGSAALALAYVACGRLDGFVEGALNTWDMAAGIALITAAGGKVTGWRGDTIDLCLRSDVVASNAHLHPLILNYLG